RVGIEATVGRCDDGNTNPNDGCSATCTVEPGWNCSTGAPSTCNTICGDSLIRGGETCDDGNTTSGDGCSNICANEIGWSCNGGEPTLCSAVCGDSRIVGPETCDDGNSNANDGCSSTCMTEIGWTCNGQPSVCYTTCGDGHRRGAEVCDDGNIMAGDGCATNCMSIELGWTCVGTDPTTCTTTCGDGHRRGTEVCDDGNIVGGDGCAANCLSTEIGWTCVGTDPTTCTTTCGDGHRRGTEVCDDGNVSGGDGCAANCMSVESGWTCVGLDPTTCSPFCGDGQLVGAELNVGRCDDGNTNNGDGCSSACNIEAGYSCSGVPSTCAPTCGDGVRVGVELNVGRCDDGDTDPLDGCDANCNIETGWTCAAGNPSVCSPFCGDGLRVGVELNAGRCDDGNTTSLDGCSNTCTVEAYWTCVGTPSSCTTPCGDGHVRGSEECDDSPPAENGDGCDSSCTIETGWLCVGTDPTVCSEECGDGLRVGVELTAGHCDDDNIANSDGCSSTCEVEFGYACVGTPSVCDEACGDLNVVGAEVCDGVNLDGYTSCIDLGFVNAGTLACLPDCSDYDTSGCLPVCNNGIVEPGEACDDGGNASGDGCSSACALETGWTCSGNPSVCNAVCGDNIVIPSEEQCDGTNLNGVDCTDYDYFTTTGLACLGTCLGFNTSGCSASCGNIVEPGESCDDGNTTATDGCSATCAIEANWNCTAPLGATSVCTCQNNDACPIGRRCISGSCTGINGDNCAAPFGAVAVSTGHDENYDNTHLATTITTYSYGSTIAVNGPDMFFSISVPNGSYLVVEVDPTFDASIALLSSCPASGTVAPIKFSDRNGDGEMEHLHHQSTANGTYYIVVQGMTALDEGTFNLRVYQGSLSGFNDGKNVVINEMMVNPTGADGYKEWVELYNFETQNYNLKNHKLDLNGTVYVVGEDTILRGSSYIVLGGSNESALNGGLDVVVWGWGAQDRIPDTAGYVALLQSDDDICDRIIYDATYPIQEGKSLSLDPDFKSKTGNNSATNFCAGNSDGTPPVMTPWFANDQCIP
ncbi:DUF4215 domain-containing protein, partial [Myxococcota bacterium]|nr:DUF4215 domain-containing protein [Myxococcota bacterium]